MNLKRRKFLAISAAFACSPRLARAATWTGYGFGAEIRIELYGPTEITRPALHEARKTLRDVERSFSLYDPNSALSELNRSGILTHPNSDFLALMRASNKLYHATEGLFDPTVQTLWQARTHGKQLTSQQDWGSVHFDDNEITLADGQRLTFNGIAQGYATDRVTEVLASYGLTEALVNIGEFRALGGPWRLGISDPHHGLLATRALTGRAIATSSASALLIDGGSHIMHRAKKPIWSTVSVEASTATLADGYSTALILASRDKIAAVKASDADVHRIVLVDEDGNLETL